MLVAVRAYPWVAATLAVAMVGLALLALGRGEYGRWPLTAFVLVVAVNQLVGMIREFAAGEYGLDILAILAIVSTAAVGDYWASLIVVLMITGGEALEDFASHRANRTLTSLLERAPSRAHRVAASGVAQIVAASDVAVGDELVVLPGEIVPVDGTVLSNNGSIDEASLTGEPMPVSVGAGDQIMSGAVNGAAALRLRATRVAAESQYQRIVDLVREAQASKAPMVRLANKVAVPFTAVALVIAGVAWVVSGDPARIAQVLVVATPCPLLIAAPVAFLAGMSRAARVQVVVKGGGVLEILARLRTAAFDKTGTLTHGHPQVVAVHPQDDGPHCADELLALAAGAEQFSGHVMAGPIVAAAQGRGLAVRASSGVVEQAGHGVAAQVSGRAVRVGRRAFAGAADGEAGASSLHLPAGRLAVHVGIDGKYAGWIELADEVRAEAAGVIAELRGGGVEHVMMLTGDGAATARVIADAVGIDDIRAGLLPADKVDAVRGESRRPVMMVGDGINDAPVLAAADVGVAMGAAGATAASDSADAVIMVDSLAGVARLVTIARQTVRVAKQSIGIGIGLSVVLMLVAGAGAIPAVVGAALQELVDLTSILWALRALRAPRASR
ncbi:heavy metal translocating P-type ATPase [Rarobacter incanus]